MDKTIWTKSVEEKFYDFLKRNYNKYPGTEYEKAMSIARFLMVDSKVVEIYFSENSVYRKHGDIVALIENTFLERLESSSVIIRK